MGAATEKLVKAGWDVVAGHAVTATPRSYSAFIQGSRAEFSVAKQGYLVTKGGWFSDRSVCYLASGRPILVQDTCLADWLPIGAGVVVFSDISDALRGVQEINADYERHRLAARKMAERVFSTDVVLPLFLDVAMS